MRERRKSSSTERRKGPKIAITTHKDGVKRGNRSWWNELANEGGKGDPN